MPFDDTAYRRKRREQDPKYAAKRRATSLAWKRRHIARCTALIAAAKDKPCVDCGKQYHPCCMEFDHVRSTKKFSLSKAARGGFSVAAIVDEIAKCEIRCVLCHRLRHLT